MPKSERGSSVLPFVSFMVGVLILAIGGALWIRSSRPKTPKLDTQYQAVLLANGSVFFELEGLGTAYPVLTDVYYVQSGTNPETKAVTNVLVKRGKEWHSPGRMLINEKSIVFVEPVNPNSKVAELIAESKRQP